jgi:transposase
VVRLVTEHVGDYDSEWAAIVAVSGRLGVTSESAREIRELKRKNAELERTVEILKAGGCRTN